MRQKEAVWQENSDQKVTEIPGPETKPKEQLHCRRRSVTMKKIKKGTAEYRCGVLAPLESGITYEKTYFGIFGSG